MPEYEFFCRRCKKPFAAWMRIRQHDEQQAECPECHKADQAEKQLSVFHPHTSRKS